MGRVVWLCLGQAGLRAGADSVKERVVLCAQWMKGSKAVAQEACVGMGVWLVSLKLTVHGLQEAGAAGNSRWRVIQGQGISGQALSCVGVTHA